MSEDDELEIAPLQIEIQIHEETYDHLNGPSEPSMSVVMTQDGEHILALDFPNAGQIPAEELGSLLSLATQAWPTILEQMEAALS